MRYYQQCTMGTSLLCSIYMCLSFTPAVSLSQNLLHQARVFNDGLGERKKTDSSLLFFFFSYIHTKPPAAFGWTQHFHSSPTSSFFPLLNRPGMGTLILQEFLSCFLIFLFIIIMKFLFPPAPGGLISTSLWFSGTVFHLQQRTHTSQELAKS